MPIYEYTEETGPDSFIGLRVVVSIGSETEQGWFSFTKKGIYLSPEDIALRRVEAAEQESKWLYTQKRRAVKRLNEAKETRHSMYDTGVKGIKLKFVIEKKFRAGKWRKYYTPKFVVSGSTDNVRFGKDFNILTHGYEKAWGYAVVYYSIKKDLREANNLLRRQPPVEKIAVIASEYKRCGHKIPKQRMPVELFQNPQFWDYFKERY